MVNANTVSAASVAAAIADMDATQAASSQAVIVPVRETSTAGTSGTVVHDNTGVFRNDGSTVGGIPLSRVDAHSRLLGHFNLQGSTGIIHVPVGTTTGWTAQYAADGDTVQVINDGTNPFDPEGKSLRLNKVSITRAYAAARYSISAADLTNHHFAVVYRTVTEDLPTEYHVLAMEGTSYTTTRTKWKPALGNESTTAPYTVFASGTPTLYDAQNGNIDAVINVGFGGGAVNNSDLWSLDLLALVFFKPVKRRAQLVIINDQSGSLGITFGAEMAKRGQRVTLSSGVAGRYTATQLKAIRTMGHACIVYGATWGSSADHIALYTDKILPIQRDLCDAGMWPDSRFAIVGGTSAMSDTYHNYLVPDKLDGIVRGSTAYCSPCQIPRQIRRYHEYQVSDEATITTALGKVVNDGARYHLLVHDSNLDELVTYYDATIRPYVDSGELELVTVPEAFARAGTVQTSPVMPATYEANASVAHDLSATFSDTEAESALNALGGKVNTILTVLKNAGLMKTS